ncbi:hypothetical protein Csa_018878 [Cucumis sativus]|nr:hypothetical protein Csa_018878 [Cucumis sativus]
MDIDVEDDNYFMVALFLLSFYFLLMGFQNWLWLFKELKFSINKNSSISTQLGPMLCYSSLIKIPLSLVESLVWTSLTHYVIGFTPQPISRQFVSYGEIDASISYGEIGLSLNELNCLCAVYYLHHLPIADRWFIENGLEGDADSDGEEDEMEDTDGVEVEHLHISDY